MSKDGFFRFRLKSAGTPNGERIVMIHGLLRSAFSMLHMGWRLSREGYEVLCYEYPSCSKTIAMHGCDLARELGKLGQENKEAATHFVTHSLGGIILREALAKDELNSSLRTASVVMLAPPNQGSDKARAILRRVPLIGKIVRPLPELSSEPKAYVHRVPPVPENLRLAIIAGRWDGKVSMAQTHLKRPCLHYEHIQIPCCHTFIMERKSVVSATLSFLLRHRRHAGRDATAKRCSPKGRNPDRIL
ncbi:MAG: hypothetical protein A2X49_07940 [Lentisphaerae bacterium GWF2_52_8]|nr:MAG: hypothetical protein A2X49_07940 [Lentisphaerae bacterium GWF2_52_8]